MDFGELRGRGTTGWQGGVLAPSTLLAFAVLLLSARTVHGAVGDGLRQGSFLFHPAVFMELRYDSNVFLDHPDDEGAQPLGVTVLHLLPEVALETVGGTKAELRGRAQVDLRQYLADNPATSDQSAFGAHLSLDGLLGKDSALSLVAAQRFHWQPVPGTHQQNLSNVPTFDRIYNVSSLGARYRPGGGALELVPGYQLTYEHFFDLDEADRTLHSATLLGLWRFMPKTSLQLRALYGLRSYNNEDIPDSTPLRASLGLVGLITNRLSVQLEGGYGNSFADSGDSFESVIGSARGSYQITERMLVSAGYARDFKDSTWSSYYDSHLFDVRWQQQIGGTFQVLASVSYEMMLFSTMLVTNPNTVVREEVRDGRTDNMFRGDLAVEWRPNGWLSATLGYQIANRDSNAAARIVTEGSYNDDVNVASYVKHQGYTRIGLVY